MMERNSFLHLLILGGGISYTYNASKAESSGSVYASSGEQKRFWQVVLK